ncbi:MAG: hypothetical protein AAF192_00175 [Pseudomonadota bacterium]
MSRRALRGGHACLPNVSQRTRKAKKAVSQAGFFQRKFTKTSLMAYGKAQGAGQRVSLCRMVECVMASRTLDAERIERRGTTRRMSDVIS